MEALYLTGMMNEIEAAKDVTIFAPTDEAFTIGFWVSAGVGVLAILAALLAPSLRQRRRDAAAAGVDDIEELAARAS